jgi:hypothetical protein
MKDRDFLILGHPRGGTGYSSKLFKTFGFDVGHEMVYSSGVSSWCFAAPVGWNVWTDKEKRSQYNFKWVIMGIRHPLNIISSLVEENQSNELSKKLFEQWIQYPLPEGVDGAVERFLHFDDFIHDFNDIDFIFRIEDQQKDLYDYLSFIGYEPYYHYGAHNIDEHIVGRNINTRPKDTVLTLEDINKKYHQEIIKKIEYYGYSLES